LILALAVIPASLTQAQSLGWAVGIGGANDDAATITLDEAGNIYATGYFQGTVDFDPGPGEAYLASSGGKDIFILKLDADHNYQWAVSASGVGDEEGAAIAVDGTRKVYVAGFFDGTVDFDPGPAEAFRTSWRPGFVRVKLDANGSL
jgi:hypothetical protein